LGIPLFVDAKRGVHGVETHFFLALLQHQWEDGNVRELVNAIEFAVRKAGSSTAPLKADYLEIPTAEAVGHLDREEVEARIYVVLKKLFEARGLQKHKGLQKKIAEFLGCSDATVSRMFKAARKQSLV
jgi:transcriptional regulator with PAS, ATPase and Fis domain